MRLLQALGRNLTLATLTRLPTQAKSAATALRLPLSARGAFMQPSQLGSQIPAFLAGADRGPLHKPAAAHMQHSQAGSPRGSPHPILSKQQPGGTAAPPDGSAVHTPTAGDPVRGSSAAGAGKGSPASNGAPTTFIGVADAQGRRDYMEDRHTVYPSLDLGCADGVPRQFLAVYDGHSSHEGSEHAARRLHQHIMAQDAVKRCQGEPRSREESDAMEEALKEAFVTADDEMVETAVRKGKRYGTTAVCALRVGRVVYVAHAGDSRAVLCRDGRAVSLTKDHKPTTPEEAARIESQGGTIDHATDYVIENNYMLNMSRALGDPDFKGPRRIVESEPDVARVVLKPGRDAFVLLGSDGVFDVMTNQEAVEVVQQALEEGAPGGRLSDGAAELAAQSLVQRALKLKTNDNVTAVVMLVGWQ